MNFDMLCTFGHREPWEGRRSPVAGLPCPRSDCRAPARPISRTMMLNVCLMRSCPCNCHRAELAPRHDEEHQRNYCNVERCGLWWGNAAVSQAWSRHCAEDKPLADEDDWAGTCLLPVGHLEHGAPHRWTPDSEIIGSLRGFKKRRRPPVVVGG